jgi:hypothetical protein
VWATVPKPSEAMSDLLGSHAPVHYTLLEPEAHPEIDWDAFVRSKQHWPHLFEL